MATPNLSDLKNAIASPVCSKCGSSDVRCEAFAVWKSKIADWRVAELLDGHTVCGTCGQDCELNWKVEKAA